MDSLPSQLSSLKLAPGVQRYSLGNWKLQSGQEIPDAHIAFKTFGDPSSPAIIYPSWFSGAIADNEWLIGEDQVLNPQKYFIIITALFGNGESTSPSNSSISPFPKVTFYDNVRAQHTLVTSHLQITHARAVIGWSMGAGQTYQWATMYPSFMDICIPFCGSAKTALHNQVFLEGVKSALLAAKSLSSAGSQEGVAVKGEEGDEVRVWSQEEREVGLKAFGRGYAGWGFSQAFYRKELFKTVLGFKDLEDFMQNFWEKWALSKDPENLLTMLHTWASGDVSNQSPYNGDFAAAMGAIKAQMLVLPGKTDLYFPPEDSEIEVSLMRPGIGKLDVFPSIWGHWAGGPGDSKEDVKWLNERLVEIGL
ncbi:putative homoserine acetyltransferase family protein [Botrytis fragariae]|uniref:Putative homoserine acetyltransferase family protein n=1 Tax=Botrytis fragariae TaxID=1964551 RepID=A0A8H6AU13_9HELO|nr:putative homoserine acetyltransferase family protein [Botrytis fragariae]KAF5873380.1 putative homoserine acetyltransferase family protein [Botrytis fragariae]